MKIIDYLEATIKISIINDVIKVALFHSRRVDGINAGHFGIPRLVFCYVDYLGYIAFEKNSSTANAERFLREYFPPHYHQFAELLYSMWRHGTVHEFVPKSYYLNIPNASESRIEIKWLSNNSNNIHNRNENLKIYCMEGDKNNLYLIINICQLADDLLFSLDALIAKINNDGNYMRECENRQNQICIPVDYSNIKRTQSKEAVKKQLLLAKDCCAGVINNRGSVVRRYVELL